MRPSKLTHLVAVLRTELGFTQEEFGNRIGISRATVRAIEIGQRNLSQPIAEKISAVFDVKLDSVRLNDLSDGLRDRKGNRWTNKTRAKIDKSIKQWGNLAPQARLARLTATQELLGQYLTMKDFFSNAEPLDSRLALNQWVLLFWLVSGALRRLQECEDYRPKEFPPIESIIDDIRAVNANVAIWKRETRKLERQKEGKKDAIRRFFAERYGWDENGLAAIQLAHDLGFEKAVRMPPAEFSRVLNERLKEKGLLPLAPEFGLADAVAAVNDFYQEFRAKTSPLPPSVANARPASDHKSA
jgi:putative transcriptional regulator